MAKAKQLNLIKDPRKNTKLWWIRKQHVYGGSLNYRKVSRPFDSSKLSHTVLKANLGSALSFRRFKKDIDQIIQRSALRYGLKLVDQTVQKDHIHLLTYTKSREAQVRFHRFVSAEIGRFYARLRRNLGYRVKPLWRARPFTRLVSWAKKSLFAVKKYIRRNHFEVMGFIEVRPRNHRLNFFLARWSSTA